MTGGEHRGGARTITETGVQVRWLLGGLLGLSESRSCGKEGKQRRTGGLDAPVAQLLLLSENRTMLGCSTIIQRCSSCRVVFSECKNSWSLD